MSHITAHPILLVSAQPDAKREAMGLTRNCELDWFRSTLGLSESSTRIQMISAADDGLPQEIPYSGVIIGGSAHSVYENSPWMENLKVFVRKVHHAGIPLLGVCFGAHIVAETFGGQVQKGEKLEAGLIEIELTQEGMTDPLFQGVETHFDIYAYHADGVHVPPQTIDTVVLARNQHYPFQAFGIGKTTRAVQFHPEIGRQRIEQALSQRRQSLIDGREFTEEEFQQLLKDLDEKEFEGVRRTILQNFDRYFVQTFVPESAVVAA